MQSEPVQAFFAGFELKGQADNGELTLISPLGSILGIMRWTPSEAVLEQNGSIKRFASTDELLTQTTGAAVPAGEPGELVLTTLRRVASPAAASAGWPLRWRCRARAWP